MGKNTTKERTTPTTPQAVLEEGAKVSADIKAAADYTDLGAVLKFARTIQDPNEREAYYANHKDLRNITEFDYARRINLPLVTMQAASATGNSVAAQKAATQLAQGLEAFAEISPEFKEYVKGLEDRIAALEGNDQVQDARLDAIEQCLSALTRGEQVKPFDPHKGQEAQPTPAPTTPSPTIPPKTENPITDAESLARAAGAEHEEPDQGNKGGFFQKIVNAFRLGTSKDGSTADSDKPAQGKYWRETKADDNTNATNGTHGKE